MKMLTSQRAKNSSRGLIAILDRLYGLEILTKEQFLLCTGDNWNILWASLYNSLEGKA